VADGSERQREQFQQIVDDWADLANRLVSRSAALAKRMVRQEPEERPGLAGPLQDLWMTLAEAAGDIAELSYRWVQAVDGLAGFSPGPGPGAPSPATSDAARGPAISPAPGKKAPGGRRPPPEPDRE
jgi:hypothetical protein